MANAGHVECGDADFGPDFAAVLEEAVDGASSGEPVDADPGGGKFGFSCLINKGASEVESLIAVGSLALKNVAVFYLDVAFCEGLFESFESVVETSHSIIAPEPGKLAMAELVEVIDEKLRGFRFIRQDRMAPPGSAS